MPMSPAEVRVAAFEIGRRHDMPGKNAIAEAGRKAFDLPLDGRQHIGRRRVEHVAVRPQRVLSAGARDGSKRVG